MGSVFTPYVLHAPIVLSSGWDWIVAMLISLSFLKTTERITRKLRPGEVVTHCF